MRWIGFGMIFLASAGGGYYASMLLEKRKEQLFILRRAVLSLKREIDYQLSPLSEAFCNTAHRIKEPWAGFFEETGRQLLEEGKEGRDFVGIWEERMQMAQKFHPWKKDLSLLKSIGQGLGQLDKKMQLSQLTLLEEELSEAEKEAEEERRKKGHLYRMLGPCMGILGILLLL